MQRSLAFMIALLWAAPVAVAEELQFGWRTTFEYESELVSQNGGDDDFIATFGPVTRLEGEHRRFDYEIEHFSGYEKYDEFSDLDDWRHELRGRARYQLSPRIELEVSDSFTRLPTLRTGSTDVSDPDLTPGTTSDDVNVESGALLANVFSASVDVTPTARLSGSSEFTHIYRDFDDPTLNSQDTSSSTILNQLTYRWSESHQFGAGFRYSERDFETASAESTTSTWETFASWLWRIDSRSTFSAQFGPSWSGDDRDDPPGVRLSYWADDGNGFLWNPASCPMLLVFDPATSSFVLLPALVPDDCLTIDQPQLSPADQAILTTPAAELPLFPPGDYSVPDVENDETDVNLFFSFGIDRRWDRFAVDATWSRSDSQTESLGSSDVVDSFLLSSRYEFSRRMRLTGAFAFTRRFSDVTNEVAVVLLSPGVSPIPGLSVAADGALIVGTTVFDRSFEQTRDTYNFQVRLHRDWGRYSSAFVGLNVRHQETEIDSVDDTLDSDVKTDSWQVQIGFTYHFQPIRF